MEKKVTVAITKELAKEINVNEWLIHNIQFMTQYGNGYNAGESYELPLTEGGDYVKAFNYMITFIRVIDGVAVDMVNKTLTVSEMTSLLASYPTCLSDMVSTAYDALEIVGEIPANAVTV